MRGAVGGLLACALTLVALPPVAAAGAVETSDWGVRIAEPGTDEVGGAAASTGGATYVALESHDPDDLHPEWGEPADEVLVTRLEADGERSWTRRFGTDDDDSARAVAAGSWGVVVLSDTSYWGPATSGQKPGFTLRRYDAAGALVWSREVGTGDSAAGVAVAGDDVVVAGASALRSGDFMLQRFSLASGVPEARSTSSLGAGTDDWYTAAATVGTSVVAVGTSYDETSGDRQAVVRRIDPATLAVTWQRTLDTAAADTAADVSALGDRLYVSGTTNGTFGGQASAGGTDGYVAAYDLSGSRAWVRQHGTPADDPAPSVAATADGAVTAISSPTGPTDVVVRSWAADGRLASTGVVGTPAGSETAADVVWDQQAGVRVLGVTAGAFLGPTTGDRDGFVTTVAAEVRRSTAASFSPAQLELRPDTAALARLRITNTGTVPATMVVQSCAPHTHLRLRAFDARGDEVTWKVQRGTWRTSALQPGQREVLTVRVKATWQARPATHDCRFTVRQTTAGAPTVKPVLRVRVVRARR